MGEVLVWAQGYGKVAEKSGSLNFDGGISFEIVASMWTTITMITD